MIRSLCSALIDLIKKKPLDVIEESPERNKKGQNGGNRSPREIQEAHRTGSFQSSRLSKLEMGIDYSA